MPCDLASLLSCFIPVFQLAKSKKNNGEKQEKNAQVSPIGGLTTPGYKVDVGRGPTNVSAMSSVRTAGNGSDSVKVAHSCTCQACVKNKSIPVSYFCPDTHSIAIQNPVVLNINKDIEHLKKLIVSAKKMPVTVHLLR